MTAAATSNPGIVDLDYSTLIFDTFLTPKAGRYLRQTAEERTDRPVSLVVNSHYHDNHTCGNQKFPHIPFLLTKKTYQLTRTQGQEELVSHRTDSPRSLAKFFPEGPSQDLESELRVN